MGAKSAMASALGADDMPEGQEITFWGLFAQSVILQAIMALVLLATIVTLVIMGQPIPEIVAWGFSLILGFYFGSKTAKK